MLCFVYEEALFEKRAQRRVADERREMDKKHREQSSSCDR